MSDLIIIKDSSAIAVFSSVGGLDSIIEEARAFVRAFQHDTTSEAGRKKSRSLGHKVSKLKTRLDALGKSLTDEWAQNKKAVDVNRRSMRKALDDLKAEALLPVVEWEEAQRVVYEALVEAQRISDLEIQKESDHEVALLYADKFNRDLADAIEEDKKLRIKAEADRKAEQELHDKRVADEATAKVIADGIARDAESARQLEESKRIARDLIDSKIKADLLVEQRAEYEAKKKIVDDAKAKADQERRVKEAVEADRKRQQDDLDLIEREREKREKNKRHISNVRRVIKEAFMEKFGIDEDKAIEMVLYIHNKNIDKLVINY